MSYLPTDSDHGDNRAPYRPPIGLPMQHEGRWGTVVSVLLHVLIVLLIVMPFMLPKHLDYVPLGAGGPGEAGGGGGGHRGTGGEPVEERLRYMNVAPPAPTPRSATPPVTPPVVPPVTPPVTRPVPKPETPVPSVATTTMAAAPSTPIVSLLPGVGGGSGNDGTAGAGPGSGGGIGSGSGTGRGSGSGPGTGGGETDVYEPVPTVLYLPPANAPRAPRPYHAVALFDVDERGHVLSFTIEPPSQDGDYNSKLHDAMKLVRFRPATRRDGTPVRAVARIIVDQ